MGLFIKTDKDSKCSSLIPPEISYLVHSWWKFCLYGILLGRTVGRLTFQFMD